MRAQLMPIDEGNPLEITKDMTLIGRGEMCDLRIDHKSVSKMHCVIVRTDGLLLLRDLGSTNGTRVNGQRVRRAALLPNDMLSVAGLKYKVLFGEKLAEIVDPDEHTQRIEAKDLEKLKAKKKTELKDSSDEIPALPIQPNPLPDVYPEKNS